ncbi:aspartate kinase [Bradymonadaceae bacterium TMQ3]|uniref:Aspartokinase n=1 Tax=Lujinxingia sediminis TaxID=2480984 RepID=A0ABY0CUV5_9DELT|nr:aspartate kinase [Bradymonadaceae bacterium TMQ3]RVU44919.1 aspartate kinase [Lujinxingia sediminis]TXC76698.1 aspartate kinase [Bradymonadales bacterium TMQ1]
MKVIVQKFGGSSLSDLSKIRQVAEAIVATRERGYQVVVVVSAMGDTTDDLLGMANELAASPSRRELDMLLSVGERISMALMSIAIQARGHQAVSLTGSQCGILTTASHSNARIIDVRPFRVQDELAQGRIVIVAGFQGTSYRRDVTTLGRGGSDTTAVALAAALGAEACEIYSDVDGVFSADPRVVLSARQLESLSYEEMQEMARAGAKVLNEQAVEFARRAQIALYARSTQMRGEGGTVVRVDLPHTELSRLEEGRPAVAVSHIRRGLRVCAGASADRVAEVIEALATVCFNWQPGGSLDAFIGLDDVHGVEALETSLCALGADVKVSQPGMISVVGLGVGGQTRWSRLGEAALREAGVKTLGLSASLARLSWIVEAGQVEAGANALHEAFVGEPLPV